MYFLNISASSQVRRTFFILFVLLINFLLQFRKQKLNINIVPYSIAGNGFVSMRKIDGKFLSKPSKSLLLSSDYFSKRLDRILVADNYAEEDREAIYSIVISTWERAPCLERSFYHILANRPPNSEIIIVDDASNSSEKVSLLHRIRNRMYKNVYILVHDKPYGAFHTKLDGFLYSVGDFIMSIDDDDFFDEDFYKEMAENCDINYDYIMGKKIKILPWVKRFLGLPQMITGIHNHVTFAFQRKLLAPIPYPYHDYKIIRDDAVLMIPMYLNTLKRLETNGISERNFSAYIKIYDNRYQYILDKYCPGDHEQNRMKNNKLILNGYDFLIDYAKSIDMKHRTPLITASYRRDVNFRLRGPFRNRTQ
ncbi:hypothetical protein TRFO_16163 [Tritrichomonas foetus]|uniref:Glycosyltransferase 2-like domain-containing protein n=1 Tax=Tritrichomonas foetus TaxID=1144522 RepID=A0A1J4KQT5_9EUKA|nr:hypothetical protein TRFO_16163 [Tritrichomonas foetus]|eukprot:OHT13619.1 hypothetical protein TRFO_16163 [Tritrichomonas foetus]